MGTLVRFTLWIGVLSMWSGAAAADARWAYLYEDDFSTDQATEDSYDHAIFWPEGEPPPSEPYLFYTESIPPPQALGFAGYQTWEAHLAYCFPLEGGAPPNLFGVMELDVYEWLPGGRLVYELSPNGEVWTHPIPIQPGHHKLPLASDCGTCYVYLMGGGLIIDNIRVRIIEAADVLYVDDDAPSDPGPGDPTVSDPLEDGTLTHPFDAVQEVIDMVQDGVQIVLADGIYSGQGNRNIDFLGKCLMIRSASGPANCVIDCQNEGRGFHFHGAEPPLASVTGLTITNGGGVSSGGGVCCVDSSPTIINCVITANTVVGDSEAARGGGVYFEHGAPRLINCVIAQNHAQSDSGHPCYGGGLYCALANATIANCTITANELTSDGDTLGGGVYCYDSSPTIDNCILWNDTPDEIHVHSGSPTVRYSDVAGGSAGDGNIDADPRFVSSSDWRLASGSPCIDAGDDAAVPYDYTDLDLDNDLAERVPCDLDGNPRFADDPLTADTGLPDLPEYVEIVDMGAFELQRCQFSSVETFEGGSNVGGWTYGSSYGFIDPVGGNPGAFFHDPGLVSVAPHPITTQDSIFTGDYRAMQVFSLGIDLTLFYAEYSADDRPFSLILISDNGTPNDHSDNWGVYYVGDQNIPPIGGGWVSYEFDIPSQATALPEGWDFIRLGLEAPMEMDWNDAITDVAHVMYCYGDPSMVYFLQAWDTGFDNPRITLARTLGDLDFDGDVDLSDLAALLANYGTVGGASYTGGDLDFDGDIDLADLAALLAAYGTGC